VQDELHGSGLNGKIRASTKPPLKERGIVSRKSTMKHKLNWHPVWDTLRMAACVLIAFAMLADITINGGGFWLAAIAAVVIVGMAS
jgi:uncharacterized membrane protein YccC